MKRNILIEEQYLEACEHYYNDELAECKKILHELLEDYPDYAPAHEYLGSIYYDELKDTEQAERHYMLAINYAKNRSSAYYKYLTLLTKSGRYEEAARLLDRMEQVKGINKQTLLLYRGEVAENSGKLREALALYKKALRTLTEEDYCEYHFRAIWRVRSKQIELHPLGWIFRIFRK